QRHHSAVCAHPAHLLVHDRRIEEVRSGAAVLGRRAHAEESFGAGALPALAVAHAARVPPRDLGSDLLLDEPPHLAAEQLVVLGVEVASHLGSYRVLPGRRRPVPRRGRGVSCNPARPPRNSRVTNAVAPSTSAGWRSTMRSATSTATPAMAAVRESQRSRGT